MAKKNNALIIAFDQDCLFCNKSILLLAKLDTFNRFYFCKLSQEIKKKASNEHTELIDSILVFKNNLNSTPYTHASALKHICKQSPFLWVLLPIFYLVPIQFLDSLYKTFAKKRYAWFGKNTSCVLENISTIKKKVYNSDR